MSKSLGVESDFQQHERRRKMRVVGILAISVVVLISIIYVIPYLLG